MYTSVKQPIAMQVSMNSGYSINIYHLDDAQYNFLKMIIGNPLLAYKVSTLENIIKDREYKETDLELLNLIRIKYISELKIQRARH